MLHLGLFSDHRMMYYAAEKHGDGEGLEWRVAAGEAGRGVCAEEGAECQQSSSPLG